MTLGDGRPAKQRAGAWALLGVIASALLALAVVVGLASWAFLLLLRYLA